MYSLVLTLGHNSSVILIKDGKILCGYENERLSGIKSDSQFPSQALRKICMIYKLDSFNVEGIYISHWDTFADIDSMSEKHWKPDVIDIWFKDVPIYSHEVGITHHDAHALAARVFAEKTNTWEIVADGFGNYNETMSIYNNGELVLRAFGFEKSLGLFFQYTTAFLGLKMNQDEYKLLGFEAYIEDVLNDKEINDLQERASRFASIMFKSIIKGAIKPKYDLVAGLEALPEYREFVRRHLIDVLKSCNYTEEHALKKEGRIIIAYYAQYILEQVMISIVSHFNIGNVTLSGGVFMNVKLNNTLSRYVDELCIYPICGDQGAGLGVYQYYKGDLQPFNDLLWGKRTLSSFSSKRDNLKQIQKKFALDVISGYLRNNYIINVVQGNMEFGARALGNTSTLALPTKENVSYINMINGRDTIMPMAAMVHSKDLINYVNRCEVTKSLEFMILTLDSVDTPKEDKLGCYHKHPIHNTWSNRVQVCNNGLYEKLTSEFGEIINTSFNIHGQPIVFDESDIMKAHDYQTYRDIENRVITLVIT